MSNLLLIVNMVDANLSKNIQEQLDRLLTQLNDLDELKEEVSQSEYDEIKADTLKQITEFEAFLERSNAGDMGLTQVTEASKRLQEAKEKMFGISDLKKTFESKESSQIRDRLQKCKI